MISVIIPYYNPDGDLSADALLLRAVSSAVSNLEGLFPYEILVINDGSPSDPSPEVLETAGLRYFRCPHGRLGAARNYGIDNASGDIVTFLDADDYYFQGSLAPCIRAMSDTGADLLGFGMRKTENMNGTDNPVRREPVFEGPVTGNAYMSRHNLSGSACRYLISASLIRENGLRFMENVFIEDEEFTPRMVWLSRRFVNTSFPVYAYCIHPGTITTSSSRERNDEKATHTIIALRHLINFRDRHIDEPHEGLDRKINYLSLDHLRRTLRRKEWKEVIRHQKEELSRMGLFPLQDKGYPPGFRLYSLLSRSRTGLHLLHLAEKFCK
ncbi:MAG: glycosyltransferase [Bacteroidaceae bacterium]|nr:glycosyltransferase [Bacteroidaceae bacterium]